MEILIKFEIEGIFHSLKNIASSALAIGCPVDFVVVVVVAGLEVKGRAQHVMSVFIYNDCVGTLKLKI